MDPKLSFRHVSWVCQKADSDTALHQLGSIGSDIGGIQVEKHSLPFGIDRPAGSGQHEVGLAVLHPGPPHMAVVLKRVAGVEPELAIELDGPRYVSNVRHGNQATQRLECHSAILSIRTSP